jgi:hypothetical protein
LSFEGSESEDSGSENFDNEDESPATRALPPLSSDGLAYTSPIAGTKEEKLAKVRAKAAKKRLATIASKQAAAEAASEEDKTAIFEEIQEKLSSNGLSFGQLMLYVFDPLYKQGAVRWEGFFQHRGLATQILNFWVFNKNSATVRQEVGTWAEDYVAEQMRNEAEGITASKQLQTADTAIDNKYVTGFSMLSMGTYIQTAACISMKMLGAFATSSRNLKTGLAQRVGKRFTVRFLCLLGYRELVLSFISDYNCGCASSSWGVQPQEQFLSPYYGALSVRDWGPTTDHLCYESSRHFGKLPTHYSQGPHHDKPTSAAD